MSICNDNEVIQYSCLQDAFRVVLMFSKNSDIIHSLLSAINTHCNTRNQFSLYMDFSNGRGIYVLPGASGRQTSSESFTIKDGDGGFGKKIEARSDKKKVQIKK